MWGHSSDLYGDFIDNGTTTAQNWFIQVPGQVVPGFVLMSIGELGSSMVGDFPILAGETAQLLHGRFQIDRQGVPGTEHFLFQGVSEFGWAWFGAFPTDPILRIGPNAPVTAFNTGALPLPVVRVVEIPEPTGLTGLSACMIVSIRRASQFHRIGCHV